LVMEEVAVAARSLTVWTVFWAVLDIIAEERSELMEGVAILGYITEINIYLEVE
jgi:hypothetical protein